MPKPNLKLPKHQNKKVESGQVLDLKQKLKPKKNKQFLIKY